MRNVEMKGAVAAFRTVCDHAYDEQDRFLARILRDNAQTEYGKKHGFAAIRNAEAYRQAVPLSTFADYDSYITRTIGGERGLLTAEEPVFYNISAGSTGAPKYIPLCREDVRKQHRYLDMTVHGIIRDALPEYSEEELFGCVFDMGDYYLTYMPDGTMNGVRSGVSFREAQRLGRFDASHFTAPEEVMFPGKLEDMLYPKIRFALENEHVTAIHGLFAHRAVGLFDYIARHWDRLVDDIETGSVDSGFKMSPEWRAYLEEKFKPNPQRAAQLRALDRETLREGMLGKIWKRLRYVRVISGNMFTVYSGKLATYLAGIPLHSYAYAASESNIGIAPRIGVTDEYALLPDVCYFEFIPEAQIGRPKDCLTFRDAREGERYELVITTLNGLYRYRLGDVVEVTGFLGGAPTVRVCYRKDLVISILDERVNTAQFDDTMRVFSERTGIRATHYCVASDHSGERPKYVLYLESGDAPRVDESEIFDRCLGENSLGYKSVRALDELDRAEVRHVETGTFERFQNLRSEKGIRMEQAKLLRVINSEEQRQYFEAARRKADE